MLLRSVVTLRRAAVALTLVCGAWSVSVACSSSTEPGLEAALVLVPAEAPPLTTATERRFSTDLGYEVSLSRGYLVLEHLEIYPCVEPQAWQELPTRSWFALGPRSVLASWLAPGTAWAHASGNPMRISAPVVVDLLEPPLVGSGEPHVPAASGALRLGTLRVPPGNYCALQHSVGPADADAALLPDAELVGKSVWLSLQVSGGGLAEPLKFELISEEPFDGFYALTDLVLDEAHPRTQITIRHHGLTWFDAIDFASVTPERALQRFLRNFRDSVKVAWE